ncbi:hypothetical protein BHE74_00052589 [Ensete ventricosum]|nr:hypothetical protein BHE74_00052589 [Ensete ventricosum]
MPGIAATTPETRQNRQTTQLSDPPTHYDPPTAALRLKLKRTHGVQIQAPGLPIAPEIAIRAKKKPPSIGNAGPDRDPGRRRGRRAGRAAGGSRDSCSWPPKSPSLGTRSGNGCDGLQQLGFRTLQVTSVEVYFFTYEPLVF